MTIFDATWREMAVWGLEVEYILDKCNSELSTLLKNDSSEKLFERFLNPIFLATEILHFRYFLQLKAFRKSLNDNDDPITLILSVLRKDYLYSEEQLDNLQVLSSFFLERHNPLPQNYLFDKPIFKRSLLGGWDAKILKMTNHQFKLFVKSLSNYLSVLHCRSYPEETSYYTGMIGEFELLQTLKGETHQEILKQNELDEEWGFWSHRLFEQCKCSKDEAALQMLDESILAMQDYFSSLGGAYLWLRTELSQ